MTYRIKDKTGYFTGRSGIGPKMGGTEEEAVILDSNLDVIDEVRDWPMTILWDMEEVDDE